MMRNHEFTERAEEHRKALVQANEHMDDSGVDPQSLVRGLADIHIACNANPALKVLCQEMWPSTQALMH